MIIITSCQKPEQHVNITYTFHAKSIIRKLWSYCVTQICINLTLAALATMECNHKDKGHSTWIVILTPTLYSKVRFNSIHTHVHTHTWTDSKQTVRTYVRTYVTSYTVHTVITMYTYILKYTNRLVSCNLGGQSHVSNEIPILWGRHFFAKKLILTY